MSALCARDGFQLKPAENLPVELAVPENASIDQKTAQPAGDIAASPIEDAPEPSASARIDISEATPVPPPPTDTDTATDVDTGPSELYNDAMPNVVPDDTEPEPPLPPPDIHLASTDLPAIITLPELPNNVSDSLETFQEAHKIEDALIAEALVIELSNTTESETVPPQPDQAVIATAMSSSTPEGKEKEPVYEPSANAAVPDIGRQSIYGQLNHRIGILERNIEVSDHYLDKLGQKVKTLIEGSSANFTILAQIAANLSEHVEILESSSLLVSLTQLSFLSKNLSEALLNVTIRLDTSSTEKKYLMSLNYWHFFLELTIIVVLIRYTRKANNRALRLQQQVDSLQHGIDQIRRKMREQAGPSKGILKQERSHDAHATQSLDTQDRLQQPRRATPVTISPAPAEMEFITTDGDVFDPPARERSYSVRGG